jgi:NADPH-dependent 2,4-dienoyl-CoA reductase/sulfur reductase-like enzyme
MTSPPISRRRFIAGTLAANTLPSFSSAAAADNPDICIYGGTASGVMAAVTAAKQGRSVVLIEPSR